MSLQALEKFRETHPALRAPLQGGECFGHDGAMKIPSMGGVAEGRGGFCCGIPSIGKGGVNRECLRSVDFLEL